MTNRQLVESYIPMAKFIAAVCGPRCEVVLHCLDDVEHSIVGIEHGDITGRQVGDGLMNFALDRIFDKKYTSQEFVANIPGTATTPDGKMIRFSTYYIKDEKKEVVGFIGVNIDVTPLLQLKDFAETELFMNADLKGVDEIAGKHILAQSASETVDVILSQTLERIGCTDPATLQKDDKIKVVGMLHEQNIFALKGVISIVAKRLGISEPSVYRYLRELKNTDTVGN